MNKIVYVLMIIATLVPLGQSLAQGFAGDRRDEVKLDDWRCKYCPQDEGTKVSLKLHLGSADKEVYRFGNYSGLENKSQQFLDADIQTQTADGYYWATEFRNLGIDALEFESEYGLQGSHTMGFDILKIPVRKYDRLSTPFSLNGTHLQLASDWQHNDDARNFQDPSQYLQFSSGTDWERLGLDLKLNRSEHFSFDSRFQRWHKTGTQESSTAQLLHASYLPLPVDQTIQDLSASISYNQADWLLSFTATYSRFDNELDSIWFDNPYTPLVPGSDAGQLALDPDNHALKFKLHGRYNYARAASVKLSYSFAELTQDQAFIPYTTNVNLLSSLPQADLQGKVHTSDFSLRLNHRFSRDWTGRIKYRYRERDNKTTALLLRPVITDVYLAADLMTLPYDFTTGSADASLEYRPMVGHLLNLGYKHEEKQRNLQAVHSSSEAGFNAHYSATLSPQWRLKLGGERLDRDGSAPEKFDYLGVDENPLMRRFNVAERQQDKAKLQIFYTPLEQVSATVSGQYSHQDYSETELGLTENRQQNINLDLNWHPNQTVDISLFLQQEEITTQMAGGNNFFSPLWQAQNRDKIFSYGASIALRNLLDDKLTVFINVDLADANTDIHINQAGTQDYLPQISSLWSHSELKLVYQYSPQIDISFSYQYQKFTSADFAIDGVVPGSLPNLLTSGTRSNNYDVSYGLLSIGYQF
jgi:MtrB/PioB family decaheme-associated outer membrane protein